MNETLLAGIRSALADRVLFDASPEALFAQFEQEFVQDFRIQGLAGYEPFDRFKEFVDKRLRAATDGAGALGREAWSVLCEPETLDSADMIAKTIALMYALYPQTMAWNYATVVAFAIAIIKQLAKK